MLQLDNIQTSDNYTTADSLTDPLANVLELVVTVADVYCRFRPYDPDKHNQLDWGDEQRIVAPTRLLLSNVAGVEIRSAAAGTPATCTATLYQPSDPQPHAASAGATVTTLSNLIGVQSNEILVGQEGILDFDDSDRLAWSITDDPTNGRAKISLTLDSTGWAALPATLAFSSADGHTFVASTSVDLSTRLGPGDRIKLTQSSTTKFFLVTAISSSTITLYGGQNYTLANAAITAPFFSKAKSPAGFPLDPTGWTESLSDGLGRIKSGGITVGTFYNPGASPPSLALPIGAWRVTFWGLGVIEANATQPDMFVALSTTTGSASDADLETRLTSEVAAGTYFMLRPFNLGPKEITVASKTTYYPVVRANAAALAIGFAAASDGASGTNTVIRATSAYL